MSDRPTLLGRPPEILEALATWEMFRRLGFEAAVIDVGVKDGTVLAQVSVQGKMPVVRVSETSMTNDEFQAEWESMAQIVGDVPMEELDAVWQESAACRHGMLVLASLAELGVYWPKHPKYNRSLH